MRILLVEDDARTARFVSLGLREQTYAVDPAADGEDALRAKNLDSVLAGRLLLLPLASCLLPSPSVVVIFP